VREIMGVYETYGKVQLKINDNWESYKVGDKVTIPDGVYIGYEGIIVIIGRKFVGEFDYLMSKWGTVIEPEEIINNLSAIKRVIENKEE